jgi:predicted phage terminase large subunit-like protein
MDLTEHLKDIEVFHNFCLPILNPELQEQDRFFVPDFHLEIYDNLFKPDRLQLTVAPVGFAKSTLLKIFALFEVLITQKDKYVIYVSSTDTKAVEHLGAIQKILETKYIKETFKYKILSKNTHEIIIECKNQKYKIEAVASGSDIAGKNFEGIRPSLIIVDDLEDLEQAKSLERTNKLQDWLFTVLVARLPSLNEGRVRMINTVLALDSLTNRILGKSPNIETKKDFEDWKTYFYQALDKNEKSIWEERHPTESLLKERKYRPKIFARNYMNSPFDDSVGFVTHEMLRYYEFVNINNFKEVFMHADTTHTAKTTSDYFALVVLGENIKDHNYYVLDFILEKLDPEKQARMSILTYQKYKSLVRKFTYDEKANQGFGYWIKKLAKEEYNISLPIQELKYPSDKITHFEPHHPHFISNRVYLPSRHKQINQAVSQLTSFPDKSVNDDFVDGLSGVLDNFTVDQINILESLDLPDSYFS